MADRKILSDIQVIPDPESGAALIIVETDDGSVLEVQATLEQIDDFADALDLFGELEEGEDEEVEG